MHQEQLSVYWLPVYLEGMHMVYFNDHDNPEEVLNHLSSQGTHLTAWLKANKLYPNAQNYTYCYNHPISRMMRRGNLY
jgi:hypothetical protein